MWSRPWFGCKRLQYAKVALLILRTASADPALREPLELWIADVDTGQARPLLQGSDRPIMSNRLNSIFEECALPPLVILDLCHVCNKIDFKHYSTSIGTSDPWSVKYLKQGEEDAEGRACICILLPDLA